MMGHVRGVGQLSRGMIVTVKLSSDVRVCVYGWPKREEKGRFENQVFLGFDALGGVTSANFVMTPNEAREIAGVLIDMAKKAEGVESENE